MADKRLLDVLTREGVLLNVSVRYWRAHKKLKAEDLGLSPDTVANHLISLGHKKLVPAEALRRFSLIESRAHALVDANTFPFLGGIAHFLPNARLHHVTARLESLKAEFQAEHAHFLQRYADLREEASREWRIQAEKLAADPDRLVASIEAGFPPPEAMNGKYFGFDTHVYQIALPRSVKAELVSIGDQQQVADARAQAARDAQQRIRAGTEQFVADAVATLRQETAKLCNEMVESMKTGKTEGVHQKTLNRLTRFIDQFKQLNFAGDTQMEEHLEKARRELLSRSAQEYRDDVFAEEKLRDGLRKLGSTARQLAQQDAREIVERFGQMGRRRFHLAA